MVRKSLSTAQLRVYLLGTFHIKFDTQPIHLPTRKTEALISYLVLHPNVHAREKLAALFWGDSSDEKARGSLRKALNLLRKHIARDIVVADREGIQLNPSSAVWVDAIEFEGQARQLLADRSTDHSHINLEIYQDDLLADFYDDWILPLREHYHTLYLNVLLCIVERLRARSEYKKAIEYAQRVLAHDAANERAHQHLMFCYITLGERNKALGQYDECQRALQDELDVEPTRETQALYTWIKQAGKEASSLAARVTNLPIPISSFVGRSRELSKIKQLLSNARLVTLTGAGGSGKTRLAIHAATDLIDAFKDGVWWVELAPLTEPSFVTSAVAKALGIDGRSDQPLTETLKQYLRTKQLLLVFDNCEHLVEACAHLAESLLTSCADLKILTTSREALCLSGENVWLVPPLSLPETSSITLLDLLMEYEGVRLFIERASAINPQFMPSDENTIAITQICHRLDGIPLAIELAAARIRAMSVEQIAAGLDDRCQMLTASTRTANVRHQTLHAAIDWSYNLLSEAERLLFSRLSVFSGGWTLEAAEAICSGEGIEKKDIPDLLGHLVDKSLVLTTSDGQRYMMLESIRQYAREKLLEAGLEDLIIQKHLDYFLRLAETADEKIRSLEQFVWLEFLEDEHDNLTSAMEMALSSSTTLEKGCELVCSLCWYWGMVGDFVTMKYWLEIALAPSADSGRTPTRAKVLFNAGSFSVWGLRYLKAEDAKALVEESLEIWRELSSDYTLEQGQCLLTLGYIQKLHLEDDNGFEYLNESIDIFKRAGNVWWHAWALNLMGTVLVEDSWDIQLIHKVLEEENILWEKTGDQCTSTVVLMDLGTLALEHGNLIEAQGYLQESLQRYKKFVAKGWLFQNLVHLGDIARGLRQYDQAKAYYKESMPLIDYIMWDTWRSRIYQGLGYVALGKDDTKQTQEYFHQALMEAQKFDLESWKVLCIAGYAALATVRGETGFAAQLFGAFFAQVEKLESEMKEEILNPVDQIEIDNYLALCKSQIRIAEFEQAWYKGHSMYLDDVMKEILQERV